MNLSTQGGTLSSLRLSDSGLTTVEIIGETAKLTQKAGTENVLFVPFSIITEAPEPATTCRRVLSGIRIWAPCQEGVVVDTVSVHTTVAATSTEERALTIAEFKIGRSLSTTALSLPIPPRRITRSLLFRVTLKWSRDGAVTLLGLFADLLYV